MNVPARTPLINMRQVAQNVFSNWGLLIINMLSSLVLAPCM